MKKKVGTSETIREAVSFISDFDFSDYELYKPNHIKKLDTSFLTWFIGFIEGDGFFCTRDINIGTNFNLNLQTKRAVFEITQDSKNTKLLNYIRTSLGFGKIYKFEKNGFAYCRWYTSTKSNILKLIHLLNGNLILEKRRVQFAKFLNELNVAWGINIFLKSFNCRVSLQTAWLAGFSEADAGFYTNIKQNFRVTKKKKLANPENELNLVSTKVKISTERLVFIKFVTKYYITQKDENIFLNELKELLGAKNKINTLTNGKTKILYNCLEIMNSQSINLLLNYFTQFPLKGIRKIDLLRWSRVHAYKNMHVVATEAAGKKLAKLLLNLEEPAENIPLNTFAFDISEEEKTIFIPLPLSQKKSNYKKKKIVSFHSRE